VSSLAEQAGHPGDRTSVIAVGGGHQEQVGADRVPRQDLVHGPGRAEHLERGQAHPGRLVLDEDLTDAKHRRQGRHLYQRSGRVPGKPGVEGPDIDRGRRAGPGPRGGPREPRQGARGHTRGSDHSTNDAAWLRAGPATRGQTRCRACLPRVTYDP
jgi:hypothetical protein